MGEVMSKTMTLSELFDWGIAAENKARDFYLGLAQMFSSRPAVSAFWKTMSEEEEGHTRILKRSRNSLPQNRLDDFIKTSMGRKAQSLRRLSVSELLDSINNLNDAYLRAHELESSEMNVIFNFLSMVQDGKKETSILSFEQHLRKLMDFPKTFGDAEVRRGIAADV